MGTILTGAVVALIAGCALFKVIRDHAKGKGCGCNCGGCSGCPGAAKE